MKGIAKAALVFVAGSCAAVALLAGAKLALVAALGEGAMRLPDVQLERLARLEARRPAAASPLLIVGDSTASFSIDALAFPDATSLAAVNATTLEAYYSLKRALDSGAAPRCVLGAFSFVWELNRKFFWSMYVAGRFYPPADLAEIYAVSAAQGEEPGSLPAAWRELKRLAAEWGIADDRTIGRLQFAVASALWEKTYVRVFRDNLWLHRGSTLMPAGWRFEGSTELTYKTGPAPSRTEAEYFRRILGLLGARGIPLYLYEVPFADSVPEPVRNGFWRSYEELVAGLRGPGSAEVRFVRAPAMAPEYFFAAGHLTREGAERGSPFLVSSLEGCYR